MEILQMVDRMLKLANLNEISTTLILKVLKCLKGLKFGSSLMCRLPIMSCTLEIYLQSFPCSISCCFLSVQLKSVWNRKGCTLSGSGLPLPSAVTLPCRNRFVSWSEPTGFCYDPLHTEIMKCVFVTLLLIHGTDRGVLRPSPSMMHHFSTNRC